MTEEENHKWADTLIYNGGYVRLTKEGVIEIDNPQESLIREIVIDKDKDCEGGFATFLKPHKMDVEDLTKIYEAICHAGTTQTEVNLETSIGLYGDHIQDTGVFLNFVDLNAEGKEQVLFNNERLQEHRILGKSQAHSKAVLDAIGEAFDAMENGLLEAAPDTQRRMMQNVGRELQSLYRREHNTQEQGRY